MKKKSYPFVISVNIMLFKMDLSEHRMRIFHNKDSIFEFVGLLVEYGGMCDVRDYSFRFSSAVKLPHRMKRHTTNDISDSTRSICHRTAIVIFISELKSIYIEFCGRCVRTIHLNH